MLHTNAMETGFLAPEDKDLAPGCWRYWCRSREEYVLQRRVWGSILIVCLFAWAIAVTVIAVMALDRVNGLEKQLNDQTSNLQYTINRLVTCTRCIV